MAKHLPWDKFHRTTQLLSTLVYLFFRLLGLIPRHYARCLSAISGDTWFLLDRRHRTLTLENLKKAYGSAKENNERKQIARAAFRNIAMIPFEIGWSLGKEMSEIMRRCRVVGMHHLTNAHAKGKGVLVLTLHIGNWELLPVVFQSANFTVSMIYRPLDFKPADLFFQRYRSRFGGDTVPKKSAMRKVLTALDNQACVGILLDQDPRRKYGVFADFFGHLACTNKGMALLAMKTAAPVLPAFLVRRGPGFDVMIGPEIQLTDSGRKEKDLLTNTANFNAVLERIIRDYPEQWLWMHKRWKTRPKPSDCTAPRHL